MIATQKYLITIVGPTAIGKTALSIQIAKHFNCEIISADSRQFFKEMSIGTAVPSVQELAAVKHHFIHNKSVFDYYTVGDYEKEAIAKLDILFQASDFAVMVGGSGLYVNAVLNGFDDFPDIDPAIRKDVASNYEKFGIGYLQTELKKLDPEYYNIVAVENPQRLMRALEVSIGTAKPYSSFLKGKLSTRNFTPIVIGLEADREVIYARINERADLMMAAGLLQEAEKLCPHMDLNALQTVGYRELFSFFNGEISLDAAIGEIKKNTRHFAKRQMTWFKKMNNIRWFDFTTDDRVIISYIREKSTEE